MLCYIKVFFRINYLSVTDFSYQFRFGFWSYELLERLECGDFSFAVENFGSHGFLSILTDLKLKNVAVNFISGFFFSFFVDFQ